MNGSGGEPLLYPVDDYVVKGYHFGERVRSRIILWARHLGDDVVLSPETPVKAIGAGRVVWSEIRPGNSERRNWGGLVVIEHTHKKSQVLFYSLYGHMKDLEVKAGDQVLAGRPLGKVAPGPSPENGWWKTPHLHFGIYVGPWTDAVLPGYKRFFDDRTKFTWWRDPQKFIEEYNRG